MVPCPICSKEDQVESVAVRCARGNEIVDRFAPPAKPKLGMNPNVRTALVLVMALFGVVSYALLGLESNAAWGLFAFGLSAGLLFVLPRLHRRYWRSYQEQVTRRQAWRQALLRWTRLYHCAREDWVFDPDTGETVPTSWMHELISRGWDADRDASIEQAPISPPPAPRSRSRPDSSSRASAYDEIGVLLAVNGLLLTFLGLLTAGFMLGPALSDPNHLAAQMLWQLIRLLGSTLFSGGLALIGFSAVRYCCSS